MSKLSTPVQRIVRALLRPLKGSRKHADDNGPNLVNTLQRATDSMDRLTSAIQKVASSEGQVALEDPGPVGIRLAKRQIWASLAGTIIAVLFGIIGTLVGVYVGANYQARIEEQRQHEEKLEENFQRAISWAASGRVYSLREADLDNRNLSGLDLGANPNEVGSEGIDLTGARLSRSNLSYTDLVSAKLSYSILDSAKLNYSDLSGAVLIEADLKHAALTSTSTSSS